MLFYVALFDCLIIIAGPSSSSSLLLCDYTENRVESGIVKNDDDDDDVRRALTPRFPQFKLITLCIARILTRLLGLAARVWVHNVQQQILFYAE